MTDTFESDVLLGRADAELVDATAHLSDPAALRACLREHSYLLVRSLIPPAVLGELQDAVFATLVADGWTDEDLLPVEPVAMPGEDAYWRVYTDLLCIEALHRLAHHPVLVDLVRAVVGEAVVVHPRKIPRVAVRHDLAPSKTTPAHQDHPYTQGGVDGLTVWVPLTPASRTRGALAVLEGSASTGIRPVRVGGEDYPCVPADLGGGEARPAEAAGVWRTTDFSPGDVLVFHALTVHAALPNTSPTARVSVDFRYRGISQPIGLTETWPPFHPFLGWWDELTRGWASTEWIELPPGARVKGIRPPQRGLEVPASRLVGSPPTVLPPVAPLRTPAPG
jgi:hypothetical protein